MPTNKDKPDMNRRKFMGFAGVAAAAAGLPLQASEHTGPFVVNVWPRVKHGTDRGGEDLFIVFSVETMVKPNLDNPQFEIGELSEDECEGSMCVEALEVDTNESITKIRFWTSYEFEWKGGKKELADLVREELKNSNRWTRSFSGETWKFRYQHFVDGNAD